MPKSLEQLARELLASQAKTFQLLAKFDSDLDRWITDAKAGYPVKESS